MDGWTLVMVLVAVAAVLIGIPLAFVLRALTRLSQRATELMVTLQEVQADLEGLAEIPDMATTLERPGGA